VCVCVCVCVCVTVCVHARVSVCACACIIYLEGLGTYVRTRLRREKGRLRLVQACKDIIQDRFPWKSTHHRTLHKPKRSYLSQLCSCQVTRRHDRCCELSSFGIWRRLSSRPTRICRPLCRPRACTEFFQHTGVIFHFFFEYLIGPVRS